MICCVLIAANPKGLLLATDVAARGLDIPRVEHVIHFQVPRTMEVSSKNILFPEILDFTVGVSPVDWGCAMH